MIMGRGWGKFSSNIIYVTIMTNILESKMDEKLIAQFHQEMLDIHPKSGKATGYWPNRFRQKVRKVGGFSAAKE